MCRQLLATSERDASMGIANQSNLKERIDMLKKTSLAITIAGFVIGTFASTSPARADAEVKAGVLTCSVAEGWSFVFGSSRKLKCTYSGSGRTEYYAGAISKFGVDIGYLQSGVIVWGVLAPTTNLASGALAGHYGGATAGAALGFGANAHVLIGGSTEAIALQPLSVEGDTGINVAAGIAEVTLRQQP